MEDIINLLFEQISQSLDNLPDFDFDDYTESLYQHLDDGLHQHITSFSDISDELRDNLISKISADFNISPEQVVESMNTVDTLCAHDFSQTIPHGNNIAFGNLWDDNAAKFLAKCREYGVDAEASLGRSPYGGLYSGDKSYISVTLDHAKAAGKITDSQYDELKSLLNNS